MGAPFRHHLTTSCPASTLTPQPSIFCLVRRPFRLARALFGTAVLALLAAGGLWAFRFELRAWQYRDTIEPAAVRYGVPPRLIAAVIWQETHFHHAAVGRAGELGLMQVRPVIGQEWAKKEGLARFSRADLIDPETNILVGAWCLRRATDRWADRRDPLPIVLAEYNAGHAQAFRWERTASTNGTSLAAAITYPSTQQYVADVLLHYRTFGRPWLRLGNSGRERE